ncbi:MAG: hypothetical protein HY973_04555 [Candidatus Kerfeldbacteria bacterium]|nr:hypothetical protein [Candidatus Kerfeldbacteria bacterium]
MIGVIKKIGLFVVMLLCSYLFSPLAGELYDKVVRSVGGWIDFRPLIGLPAAFIFFLPLLFTAFGGLKKYWWIGILLLPAAAFEVYFDWAHIYFPIAIGLIGWLLGLGISRLLSRSQDV